ADISALIGPSPKEAGRDGLAEAAMEGNAEERRERDDRETKNEKAANGDDADAMYDLGVKYNAHAGVEFDLDKAREWLEKAAAKGHAEAKDLLGSFYFGGEGPGLDIDEWYKKAAAKGDADAMYGLGERHYRSKEKDFEKAREWFEKAAAKDHTEAMNKLGW